MNAVSHTWKIIESVSRYYGVRAEDVLSRSRRPQFIKPRFVSYFLCRALQALSNCEIGRRLDRDPKVILRGIRKLEKFIADSNGSIAADLDKIITSMAIAHLPQ